MTKENYENLVCGACQVFVHMNRAKEAEERKAYNYISPDNNRRVVG